MKNTRKLGDTEITVVLVFAPSIIILMIRSILDSFPSIGIENDGRYK